MITGFCGRVFSQCSDPELGLAFTKASERLAVRRKWYSPTRSDHPLGITFLTDPFEGAAEIRRNAERGFRSVTLPERPLHRISCRRCSAVTGIRSSKPASRPTR